MLWRLSSLISQLSSLISRQQHGLRDTPRVHRLKRLVPLFQRPGAADDRGDVQEAGGQQPQYALPDGPVVAEASLQRDVFLNQRIKVKTEGVAAPANLGDPARGADQIKCYFKRGADARGGGLD